MRTAKNTHQATTNQISLPSLTSAPVLISKVTRYASPSFTVATTCQVPGGIRVVNDVKCNLIHFTGSGAGRPSNVTSFQTHHVKNRYQFPSPPRQPIINLPPSPSSLIEEAQEPVPHINRPSDNKSGLCASNITLGGPGFGTPNPFGWHGS